MGNEIDRRIEREISRLYPVSPNAESRESNKVTALSVDSAWLKHCSPVGSRGRQVNVIAGRATLACGESKLYAYVGKQIPSAAARLDHFLAKLDVRHDERVTVISDGAGEFAKAVDGSRLARGQILDWFHIVMKFRAAELSVVDKRLLERPDWSRIESELRSAKWLVWHGNGRKAIPRLQTVIDELEKCEAHCQSTLWWNVRKALFCIRSHARFLVNYCARYRKGLPISSSIAESAVNQVVSARMAKKQQMRWSEEGARALALVRVADLNGELSAKSFTPVTQLRPKVAARINRAFYGAAA